MATLKKFSAALQKNVQALDSFASELKKENMKVKPAEARAAKKTAMAAFSQIVKLRKSGVPENAVDRALVQQLKANDAQIKKQLETLLAKRKATPLDYYKIYYKVLEESGMMTLGQLRPEFFSKLKARASGCNWCKACSACSLCSACVVSGTAALGATAP